MPKRFTLAVVLVLLAACSGGGGSSPTEPKSSDVYGRLSGVVTIGPNCPGPIIETAGPCPTPPDAYAARKILVYNAGKTTLMHGVDIDSQGLYTILLVPGTYVLDLQTKSAADRTNDLPQTVTIQANGTLMVNVNIDTGIR